jgi:hypothetical protein
MRKLIIFALLAIMVSCKKDDPVLPEVCDMWKYTERRVVTVSTGVFGNWEPHPVAPTFYSKNCGDEGKIIPGNTHYPDGQILTYRYVIRRKR